MKEIHLHLPISLELLFFIHIILAGVKIQLTPAFTHPSVGIVVRRHQSLRSLNLILMSPCETKDVFIF